MLKLLRKQKPKMIITACVCLPLLVIPESQGTPTESEGGMELASPSPSEEGESCMDLGLYQPVYVEFAEVLSQYNSEKDLLEFTNQSPMQILENLEQRGYKQAAVAGGSAINKLFLNKNLIDEIYLTVEPRIFGSGKRIFDEINKDISLELIDHSLINENSVLLHYKVKK